MDWNSVSISKTFCGNRHIQPSFMAMYYDSIRLSRCLQSFQSCSLQCERRTLYFSWEVDLANAMGEQLGGNRIALVTFGAEMSSPSIASVACCVTNAATGTLGPGFLTILLISALIKASESSQGLKVWLSVSCKTPWWIMSVITSPRSKEESLMPSVTVLYSTVKT